MKRTFFKHSLILILMAFLGISAYSAAFPVTVKDGNGRDVTVEAMPTKIVSLGAASTEILFEVGAEKQIAAVSDVSNYPAKAKTLPSIGGFDAKTISVEKILSFKPDLIIIYSGMHDFLIPSLEKFGITYYVSNDMTVADVIDEIKGIAYLTGHKSKGDRLEKKYRSILNDIAKNSLRSKKESPKIFWEVYSQPFMSAGKRSFINDVITLAGGKNIFAEVDQAYPVVSEETIIASNPDFILLPNDMYGTTDIVKQRRGWEKISAVRNGRIIIFNADIYTRPGPRIFDALKELNKILYAK